MWAVTAEAPVDEIYEALKEAFDKKHVKKRAVKWTVIRGATRRMLEHSKPEHVPASEGGLSDGESLQFRLALKAAQQQVGILHPTGNVKVSLKGDDRAVSVKVEGV